MLHMCIVNKTDNKKIKRVIENDPHLVPVPEIIINITEELTK